MSFLALDGVDLYYEVHGDGPPLVFIHGASGTHLTWWQTVAELRSTHTCLIYDQRGFGRSQATRPYEVSDGQLLQDDLRALLQHVGFAGKPINMVGASMGTGPALHFAMDHAALVDRLILLCGPGGVRTPLIDEGWNNRKTRMRARQSELAQASHPAAGKVPFVQSPGEVERFGVAYHPYGPVGEAMHLDAPALTFLYAEIMAMAGGPPTGDLMPCFFARSVTPEDAARIQFPVLVVSGTEDPLFSPSELEEVARIFPNGRCVLFKGAGHAAYYERARRFNDMLKRFLRDGHAS